MSKNLNLNLPPIFVCGVQRAGTTLLVKMLNKSEDIQFLPQESHYFPLFYQRKNQFQQFKNGTELSVFLKDKLPKVNYGWTENEAFLNQLTEQIEVDNFVPKTAAQLLRYTFKLWTQEVGENCRVGEKTPAHIYYAPRIRKEFPACKFALMCRDPRAAALSELKKVGNNPRITKEFNTFTFIVRWSTAVALAEHFSKENDTIFIRYEDLIVEPESTLKSVCRHLSVDYKKELLDVGVTNSSFQDKKQKGIRFNTQNLDRWKTELPQAIIDLIEYHLGTQMQKLNYSLSGKKMRSNFQLMKQKTKLIAAKKVALNAPAMFHHSNRNKKYRD